MNIKEFVCAPINRTRGLLREIKAEQEKFRRKNAVMDRLEEENNARYGGNLFAKVGNGNTRAFVYIVPLETSEEENLVVEIGVRTLEGVKLIQITKAQEGINAKDILGSIKENLGKKSRGFFGYWHYSGRGDLQLWRGYVISSDETFVHRKGELPEVYKNCRLSSIDDNDPRIQAIEIKSKELAEKMLADSQKAS